MAVPFVFNIAKGRVAEFYNRVESNDPANSAIILIPCSAGDTEANAQDADTVTAALATAINEQTTGSWVRKTLTNTELAAFPAPNDTDNRYDVPLPAVVWTAPSAATTHLLVAYDADTTGGTDADLVPLTFHEFVNAGTGSVDVTLNAGNFFQAG